MSESRVKYPIKTSLEVTQAQYDFTVQVADKLTSQYGKRVSMKAVWRMMNDYCRRNPAPFFASISTDRNVSEGK